MPKHATNATPASGALVILAVVLAVAVYLRALGFDFVYDDIAQIVLNSLVLSPPPLQQFFTTHVWSQLGDALVGVYYRPLFMLWLAANHALFGLNPLPWHLMSILIHAAVTYLLFRFARRIGCESITAAVGALFFAVHPIHIESVAWVSGVVDPMCAMFLLIAALCHLRARVTGSGGVRIAWVLGAMIALGLALLSKEIAATFPALIIVLEWMVIEPGAALRSAPSRLFRAIIRCLPYALVALVYLAARIAVLGAWANDATQISLSVALLSLPMVLVQYLKLFFLPIGLSITYELEYVTRPEFSTFYLPLLMLAIVAIALTVYCRGRPSVATAVMWAIITISPALVLWKLPAGDFVHDRYLYIPSLGLSMLAASAVTHLPAGRIVAFGRPALPALGTVMLVLLMVSGTVAQCAYWRNGLALFGNAVRQAPRAVIARANYGIQLMAKQRYGEAETQFRKVLADTPDSWPAIYGIGQLQFLHGRWPDAVKSLRRAIALRPTRPEQYIHLGYALMREDDISGAEAAFRDAIRWQPLGLGQYYALGIALLKQQRWRKALTAFETELSLDPGQPDTLRQIAGLKARLAANGRHRSMD